MKHIVILEGKERIVCRHCGTEEPWQAHKWDGSRDDAFKCVPLKEILDRAIEFRKQHLLCEKQKP